MNPIIWLNKNLPPMDKEKRKVIEFVFLWQEYNFRYQMEYEDNLHDRQRALALKDNPVAQNKYSELKDKFMNTFACIESLVPDNNPRTKLFIDYTSQHAKEYHHNGKDSLENFLNVIYQIRCNFLHGEKLRREDEPIDVKLIGWAKDCLEKLLNEIHYFN